MRLGPVFLLEAELPFPSGVFLPGEVDGFPGRDHCSLLPAVRRCFGTCLYADLLACDLCVYEVTVVAARVPSSSSRRNFLSPPEFFSRGRLSGSRAVITVFFCQRFRRCFGSCVYTIRLACAGSRCVRVIGLCGIPSVCGSPVCAGSRCVRVPVVAVP